MQPRTLKGCLVMLLAFGALAAGVTGPASAGLFAWTFTYQGQLTQAGTPVNGTADLVFKLFDASTGGNQAGQTITANGVTLTDGRFTIELDFTNGGVIPGVFDGSDRWLDITVNGTPLTPREKLTPSPHAIFARELALPCQQRTTAPTALEFVSDADVPQVRVIHSVTNSTQIGANAIMGEALGGGNSESVGVQGHSVSGNGYGVIGANSSPTGNCTGVYGVSQSNAGTGVFGFNSSGAGTTYGVYGKVASPNGYAGYFDGMGFFTQPVGIRTAGAPQAMLHIQGSLPSTGLSLNVNNHLIVNENTNFVGVGRGNQITGAEYFGVEAPVGAGQYGGMYIDTQNAAGWPFYGYATNGTFKAFTYLDGGTGKWYLYNGGMRLAVDGSTGNTGIGRTATANKLEVEGDASKTVAGNWSANSDARIKTDVTTITDALDKIDQVRLVSFRYNDAYRKAHPSVGDRRYVNVLAQEFGKVFPDDVKGSGEKLPSGDEILQVDTYPLTIYAAASIQELHRIVKEKDAEIARQGQELATLSARLAKLETQMQSASFQATSAVR